eukprot:TRINITY_DN23092_c0_g1_i2.p1 TRINITY_DN23092_c0_g1~~TRINITY_DN23092_c0_g1_i2.p1  ORF type:complete len:948 (+),score=176.69 TRINITY_DN23092_c0_g1_i2:58-2844(+)
MALAAAAAAPATPGGTSGESSARSALLSADVGAAGHAQEGSGIASRPHSAHHGHGGHGHHAHGPLDRAKCKSEFRSLDFQPFFNQRYNENRVLVPRIPFLVMEALLPLCIGVLTAFVATLVGTVSELVGSQRCEWIRDAIQREDWVSAWLVGTGVMLACIIAAGLPVIFVVPSAGSSGIPQLIGLLNGIDVRGQFGVRELFAKVWGVALAVASGLVVGPEGPMIFIGAAIGALASRLPQNPSVWRWFGHPPQGVSDDVYLRDYMSVGAACGIAAAFRAPVAGTLFIVEEAASNFKKEHIAKIFFGGLAALEVIILNSDAGSILEYSVTTGQGCSSYPGWSVICFLVIGGLCGIFGAMFNWINIKVMEFRAKRCSPKMPCRRLLELVCLCVLTSSCWIGSAVLFSDKPATAAQLLVRSDGCIKEDWKNQIIASIAVEKHGEKYVQKYVPRAELYGVQYNEVLCPAAYKLASSGKEGSFAAKACTSELIAGSKIVGRSDYRNFCCAFSDISNLIAGNFRLPTNATVYMDLGESMPGLAATQGDRSYNPMASMALVPFKSACQNLFARGVPGAFPMATLILFFVIFFLLGAITAGAGIPSGLLMPQMVMGGLIGRIFTQLVINVQGSLGLYASVTTADSSIWAQAYQLFFNYAGGPVAQDALLQSMGYLDPGVGAIVGAAAFLGGSGRITLFTTVMMVEITGDPLMIFPVGISAMIAVIIGNKFNHGLYHALIDVQSMPYLPDNWQSDQLPANIHVRDMMPRHKPGEPQVLTVPISGDARAIKETLEHELVRRFNISGFPVVNEKGAVVGMAERTSLQELLQQHPNDDVVDVSRVTDMHPVTVRPEYPLQMAYQLYKCMEMKNLIVVDDDHRPLAVMTRLAFLAWVVEERLTDHNPELLEQLRADMGSPSHAERLRVASSQGGGSARSLRH